MRFGAALLVVWLIIGAIAAGQRGYYNSSHTNCAKASTVFVTIVAGPLNYVGANPKVSCELPHCVSMWFSSVRVGQRQLESLNACTTPQ